MIKKIGRFFLFYELKKRKLFNLIDDIDISKLEEYNEKNMDYVSILYVYI